MDHPAELPEYACEPLRVAVSFARELSEDVRNEVTPDEYELAQEVISQTARTCGRLCAVECIRQTMFRLEVIGQELPPDSARDAMFNFVDDALIGAVMLESMETPQQSNVTTIELCTPDGPMLKDIVSRRLGLLNDTELLDKLALKRISSVKLLRRQH